MSQSDAKATRKKEMLAILRCAHGKVVSSKTLAHRLKVDKRTIWRYADELQNDGHTIVGTSTGYRSY